MQVNIKLLFVFVNLKYSYYLLLHNHLGIEKYDSLLIGEDRFLQKNVVVKNVSSSAVK